MARMTSADAGACGLLRLVAVLQRIFVEVDRYAIARYHLLNRVTQWGSFSRRRGRNDSIQRGWLLLSPLGDGEPDLLLSLHYTLESHWRLFYCGISMLLLIGRSWLRMEAT